MGKSVWSFHKPAPFAPKEERLKLSGSMTVGRAKCFRWDLSTSAKCTFVFSPKADNRDQDIFSRPVLFSSQPVVDECCLKFGTTIRCYHPDSAGAERGGEVIEGGATGGNPGPGLMLVPQIAPRDFPLLFRAQLSSISRNNNSPQLCGRSTDSSFEGRGNIDKRWAGQKGNGTVRSICGEGKGQSLHSFE
uniref:Uncharacterized protein n=1 Tax=Globodera rostochiensis TaxID=31243 RepID=A0A914H9B2_GLORO